MKRFLIPICVSMLAASWNLQSAPPAIQALPLSTAREPIKPVPLEQNLDARKVALGRKLFHEPKLSRDDSISCATCHDLGTGGTDRRARSLGIGNAEGPINAPTVFNSGFNFKQFWDGRADSLEEQAGGPVQAAASIF